ncbi:hypothetical protein H9P43_001324 [Blastocladiella emersonii ATCC 22665]|nr:hypothetical protein H9P43_001324 [Blastocladiella emersonii ATCC 22665]
MLGSTSRSTLRAAGTPSSASSSAGYRQYRGTPTRGLSTPFAVDTGTYGRSLKGTPPVHGKRPSPFKKELSYAAYSLRVDDVRQQVADALRDRGVVGVFAFIRSLKRAEFSGEVSMARFEEVLEEHRLGLSRPDMALLFNEFDERRRNMVNVEKVIDAFRMRLEPRAVDLIEAIFDSFRSMHSRVQAAEVRRRFHPAHHPAVIARRRRETDVLVEFLDTFTHDLEVTRYDLVRYYELARLACADDEEMYAILRGCWSEFVPAHAAAVEDEAVQTNGSGRLYDDAGVRGNGNGSGAAAGLDLDEDDRYLDHRPPGARGVSASAWRDEADSRAYSPEPIRHGVGAASSSDPTVAEMRNLIDREARRLEHLAVDDRPSHTLTTTTTSTGAPVTMDPTSTLPPPKSYVQRPWDREPDPRHRAIGNFTGSRGASRPASSMGSLLTSPDGAGVSSARSAAYHPAGSFSFASPVAIGVRDGQTSLPTAAIREIDALHTARNMFASPMRPLTRLRRHLRTVAARDGTVDLDAFTTAWTGAGGPAEFATGVWRELVAAHGSSGPGLSVNEIMRALRIRDPTPRRVAIVDQAFARFDALGDGKVPKEVLRRAYNQTSPQSSKSRSNLSSDMWACFGDDVTREEFQDYYADVGSTIDEDKYFVLQVWTEWSL